MSPQERDESQVSQGNTANISLQSSNQPLAYQRTHTQNKGMSWKMILLANALPFLVIAGCLYYFDYMPVGNEDEALTSVFMILFFGPFILIGLAILCIAVLIIDIRFLFLRLSSKNKTLN